MLASAKPRCLYYAINGHGETWRGESSQWCLFVRSREGETDKVVSKVKKKKKERNEQQRDEDRRRGGEEPPPYQHHHQEWIIRLKKIKNETFKRRKTTLPYLCFSVISFFSLSLSLPLDFARHKRRGGEKIEEQEEKSLAHYPPPNGRPSKKTNKTHTHQHGRYTNEPTCTSFFNPPPSLSLSPS